MLQKCKWKANQKQTPYLKQNDYIIISNKINILYQIKLIYNIIYILLKREKEPTHHFSFNGSTTIKTDKEHIHRGFKDHKDYHIHLMESIIQ